MTESTPMHYVPSKIIAPTIHKLARLEGGDLLPAKYNKLIKRDAIGQWVPNYGTAATEKAGLCFTLDGFRKTIESFFGHFGIEMTDDHYQHLDEAIAKTALAEEVGEVAVIEDLSDNTQVGMAMRSVQGGKQPKPLSHPSLAERSKLITTECVPTRTVETARTKMNKLSHQLFEGLRAERPVVGIDVEMFERNHKHILEIGLAVIQKGQLTTRHFIIDEHQGLNNGQFVPNHRDHFHFGTSEVMSLDQATEEVKTALASASALFGHAVANDIRILGIPQQSISKLKILDTQDIHKLFKKAVAGNLNETSGLGSIAPIYLGDSAEELSYHNAGNDIEITGRILLKQASPAWVNEQYTDLAEHDRKFQEEWQRVGKENVQRCLAMFRKHFHEDCNRTGTDILDIAEEKPMQALDGYRFALDIKRRAEVAGVSSTDIPLLNELWSLEQNEKGLTELINTIQETSADYAKEFLKSHERMADPSCHRQMIRIALEMPGVVKNLNPDEFLTLERATKQRPDVENEAALEPDL